MSEVGEKEKSSLRSIFENGAIIVVVITLIGYVKLFLYYKCYKIKISYYISFEEILTPFLDDLLPIVYLVIFNYAATYFIGDIFNKKKLPESKDKDKKESIIKRFFIPDNILFVLVLISIVGCSIYYTTLGYIDTDLEEKYAHNLWGSTLLLLMFLGLLFLINLKDVESFIDLTKTTLISLFVLIFILVYNIWEVKGNIHDNKTQFKKIKYSFTFENNVVETDSILVFLGRTQSKIFIQNKKENRVDIYNANEIKKEYVKDVQIQ